MPKFAEQVNSRKAGEFEILSYNGLEWFWGLRSVAFRVWFFSGALFLAAFFMREDYKKAGEILPALYQRPAQTELSLKAPVRFQNSAGHWELEPLYDYDIAGMVVGKVDYAQPNLFYNSDRKDILKNIWRLDVALVYGANAKSEIFKKCFFRSEVDVIGRYVIAGCPDPARKKFIEADFSNNHLITLDSHIRKQLAQVVAGDQIRIQGKLVDVHLKDPSGIDSTFQTSTVRTDHGCEIILVEKFSFLKKENLIWRAICEISWKTMWFSVFAFIVIFALELLIGCLSAVFSPRR